MTRDDLLALVAESLLAPSVHNVQPARWRMEQDSLVLFEDTTCRLAIGDPAGHDAAISLGAAAEGLAIAASRKGWRLSMDATSLPSVQGDLVPIARFRASTHAPLDPLAGSVTMRQSWRAPFAKATAADRAAAAALAADDAAVMSDPDMLAKLATLSDRASYEFTQREDFRREIVSWMRFNKSHPRWAIDGLNAQAMAMSLIEAWGAQLVLGRGFSILQRLGLTASLLAEGGKVANAAGLVAFHRPSGETPFVSGRWFYRLWLRIEAAGFGAAVHAALADCPEAAASVALVAGLPSNRRLVSALRIGRRPSQRRPERARRAVADVMV